MSYPGSSVHSNLLQTQMRERQLRSARAVLSRLCCELLQKEMQIFEQRQQYLADGIGTSDPIDYELLMRLDCALAACRDAKSQICGALQRTRYELDAYWGIDDEDEDAGSEGR